MRYQVPQFVEVEDKIFGPLTIKQFIYLAAGGGITLMFVSLFPMIYAIALSTPFVLAACALAFYKINERPMIDMLEHIFRYFLSSKLYIWKQRPPETKEAAPPPAAIMTTPVAKTTIESGSEESGVRS